MKSERVNVLNERDLIYQLIISDKFCREIVPILNPRLLQIEYAKIIASWIKEYFTKFKKAPKKDIIKLYRSHIEEVDDESLQDNILSFIKRLDEDYDDVKLSNEDFAIQQAVNYLKVQSLRNFSDDIEAYISSGDVSKAESLLTKYRKVEIASGDSVSILDDFDIVTEAFTAENEKLFRMSGAYGQLVGDVNREDFIAFLAPMKAGKTFSLIDVGIEALKNGLNVVFFSLEMSRTNMIKRVWKALSGQVTEDIDIEIPYFEKDGDKFYLEKKTVHKEASSVLDVKKKQKSLKRIFRGGNYKIFAEPAYSLTVERLEDKLDDLAYDNFFPDVIIIDYADIMAPSDKTDYRNQIDGIWKRLRALAQKRKAAVFTASQTNREALSKEVEAENVAEDVRKIAHVTSMVAISKTKWCKENSVAIFSQMAVREGRPELRKVVATQCLELGRPVLDSHWKDDVIFDDEDESDEKNTKRKRKKQ